MMRSYLSLSLCPSLSLCRETRQQPSTPHNTPLEDQDKHFSFEQDRDRESHWDREKRKEREKEEELRKHQAVSHSVVIPFYFFAL
jgi:hypothetical protein